MLGHVVGTVVRLPVSLVQGVEQLLHDLGSVAARAGAVLDAVESMPARVEAVLAVAEPAARRADTVITRADAVVDRAEELPDRVEAVLKRADQLSRRVDRLVTDAAQSLASVQPAVAALGRLDPSLLTGLIEESAQGVPLLLAAVEQRLLPALAQLEQLVPVVEHLGVQVDHLDATVADVGAMLSGIPGAARLLKRGATAARS